MQTEMNEAPLRLPLHPYRFDLLLEFVRRIAYPARMRVIDGALWRVTAGQLLAYRLGADAIIVRGAPLSSAPRAEVDEITAASRAVLGLQRDLSAFYDFAARDQRLWQVIAPLHGMPIFCTETAFEALITLIIEQHITWKNALRAQRCLLQMLGTAHALADGWVYDFPPPAKLARCRPEQLKALKITNRRSELIIQIARDVDSGRLDLEALLALPPLDACQRLLQIKGVGHWTAGNVLARAAGLFPTISHNDVALQAAVNHYFYAGQGGKSAPQVSETLSAYGDYGGLAGHFVLLRWVLERYPPLAAGAI